MYRCALSLCFVGSRHTSGSPSLGRSEDLGFGKRMQPAGQAGTALCSKREAWMIPNSVPQGTLF